MSATYDKQIAREKLLSAAKEVSGELTRVFFDHVDKAAPVESGHLHQTLGSGLERAGLPETGVVSASMLSKGSGDPTATQMSFGSSDEAPNAFRVIVGTNVGFVSRLNDGDTVEPDVSGNSGFKTGARGASEGILYAPRKDSGPMGFLMWYVGGQKFFTRMAAWQPQGFFEEAAVALREKAQEMGMT